MIYFQLFFILSHYFFYNNKIPFKEEHWILDQWPFTNQDRRKEGRKKGLGQSFALEEDPFQENIFFFF